MKLAEINYYALVLYALVKYTDGYASIEARFFYLLSGCPTANIVPLSRRLLQCVNPLNNSPLIYNHAFSKS